MAVSPGARLGPYEILSPLGAGGMGEVWRARDTRLGRDVAIKVLPEELEASADRLKRFEREARAASSLSHPNIVTVYEIAQWEEGTSFIVMELVEGETLRSLIAGSPLPLRRILLLAPQIAEGLARAHASGLVHRDVKPENLMVTREGIVKILDFGLAKLTRPEEESGGTAQPTVSMETRPGVAMGTVSYMSPEQALGHELDFRSDQFALGAILYEMATGRIAFRRDSAPQTLTAIIEDEPEPLGAVAPKTPAPLRWVIARCLSKEAKGRYASTEDLARELADLRDHVSELSTSAGVEIEEPPRRPRWRVVGVAAMAAAALAGVFLLGRRVEHAGVSEPTFRQLTARGVGIGSARFAPDGQTIVFSTQTEGRPPELLSMRLDSPEARPLGLPPAQILSISSQGEMAILLSPSYALGPRAGHMAFEQIEYRDPSLLNGTLASAPLGGGAPTEILNDVSFADWDARGKDLAAVHRLGNRQRVEYPLGTSVFDEERGLLNYVKLSQRGGRFAFKDWANIFVGRQGGPVEALPDPSGGLEMAWSVQTGEIWRTRGEGFGGYGQTQIYGTSSAGRSRLVATLPGDFILYDVAPDGRVLLGRLVETNEILGTFPSESRERNLSHFSESVVHGLSADGGIMVLSDVFSGDGAWYVGRTDGSAPRSVRDGCGDALSADGQFSLCDPTDRVKGYYLAPTGAGPLRTFEETDVSVPFPDVMQMRISPDAKRLIYCGAQPKARRRIWVAEIGAKPRAISPEDVRRPVVVGDGSLVCAKANDGSWNLYPVDGKGEPRKVVGILPGEEPIQSSPDGLLYVRGADELRQGETLMTTRLYRLDPATGRRELWKEIPPKDPRTGGAISSIFFSADGKTCVWTHIRYSTELVLAEGLR